MTRDQSKNGDFSAFPPPSGGAAADSARPMKQDNRQPRFGPQDLRSTDAAREALVHYEHQPDATTDALRRDPHHHARLERLQAADTWLRDQARAAGAPVECPLAEELYEYGGGPGAGLAGLALSAGRRAEIDRHLAACAECDGFVATLAAVPPSPVVYGRGEDETAPTGEGQGPATILQHPAAAPLSSIAEHRRRRAPRWLLGALAAGVVFAAGLALTQTERMASAGGYPQVDPLRGEASDALALPGGRVLAIGARVAARFPALAQGVQLELRHGTEAQSWRFDVSALAANATERPLFQQGAADGRCVFQPAAHGLSAGDTFVWEARASQGGLVKFLGRRETTLVADPELERGLLEAADELEALRLLHAGGWRMEALALARSLPASSGRDGYIEALLAR